MSVVDDYLASLGGDNKKLIGHMYDIVRQMVPDATEELSYAMPAFKYKSKSLIAIMQNKQFLSVYPFSGRVGASLADELKGFELTSGSIHFSAAHPIPDETLRKIITARMQEIAENA